MRLEYYAVHDKGVGAFAQPFASRARGEAIRNFTSACHDKGSPLHNFPIDYTLVFLGFYDDATGLFENAPNGPQRVLGATEIAQDDD
jgi:hypothetical protein